MVAVLTVHCHERSPYPKPCRDNPIISFRRDISVSRLRQLRWPCFNVLTPGALEREQFGARALSLNAKQQHCRPAFGAVWSRDRIGTRRGWLILGHRAPSYLFFIYGASGSRSPGR